MTSNISSDLLRRALAKVYNNHPLPLSMKIEILIALGYENSEKEIGVLMSGQAYLSDEGVIIFHAAEASDYERVR